MNYSMQNNKSNSTNYDRNHFNKLLGKKKTTAFHYFLSQDDEASPVFLFIENGIPEEVLDVEIHFMDADKNCYMLTKDIHSFETFHIFFLPDPKAVIGYKLSESERERYCGWGYKKTNTFAEKMLFYLKATEAVYLAYFDAQQSDQCFLITSDYIGENYNAIENLYHFITQTRKDFQYYECISEK